MANPWFRMYSEFAHDPKVQMMNEAMQRRYIMLLCMRCSNDLVTLHDDEVAFQLRISSDELAATKALFISKGFITSDWNPANWDKRQMASDTSNARVAKHRALQKEKQEAPSNDNVTLQKQESNGLDKNRTEEIRVDKKIVARGSRMPTNFEPDMDFALQNGIQNPSAEFSKFSDYWTAQPGQKGVKTDWQATWRNWCRNSKSSAKQPPEPAWRTEQRKRTLDAVPSIASVGVSPNEFFDVEARNVTAIGLG